MPLTSRQEARRTRIIDAAERVFGREGLRGASMERIAAEAGVAKATAYAYFLDKEDAFRAVAERVAERLAQSVETAMAAELDPRRAVLSALQAKEDLAYRLAHASPHAQDLLGAKSQLAANAFARADSRVLTSLAAGLAQLGDRTPHDTARRLVAACFGLAAAAPDSAALAADIAALAGAVLDALSASPARP
jgi:AcrR family transcriptional regulator